MKKEFLSLFNSIPELLRPLFDAYDTPWEILSHLSDYLLEITKNPPEGYRIIQANSAEGYRLIQANSTEGYRLMQGDDGAFSYSNISSGILVGEGAKIEDFATILSPAIIEKGATVRQGAYLRGSVFLGEGAIAGHGTEMKNTVLMDGAKAPHLSYLGDSILGENAHLGAGVILSNLRLDKGEIFVNLSSLQNPNITAPGASKKVTTDTTSTVNKKIPTGRRKLGSIIGDNTEIACGTVLNPGTIIPKNSMIFQK